MGAFDPVDVRQVVALDGEPVLRNLLITQGYHDLGERMRARTGGAYINWCTLGTWASKTAGTFIRSDEVPAAFRAILDRGNVFGRIAHAIDPVGLLDTTERIVNDTSAYIMVGNRVVFAELAQAFADFEATLGRDGSYDADALRRLQATFTEGDPEPDDARMENGTIVVRQRGGQGELRAMVADYYAAMFERDAKKRAERLLLANARGGIHEQTRLQTYIAAALDAPISETLLRHAHEHVDAHVATSILRTAAHALVDEILPAIARRIEKAWEDFATAMMMTLTLPDGVLHLGKPIPSEPGMPVVPPDLAAIHAEDLRAALAKFDALQVQVEVPTIERIKERFEALLGFGHPVSKEVIAAGAVDWVDFAQRMRYILLLFRSRAADMHLASAPFSAAQRTAIESGQVPPGPL